MSEKINEDAVKAGVTPSMGAQTEAKTDVFSDVPAETETDISPDPRHSFLHEVYINPWIQDTPFSKEIPDGSVNVPNGHVDNLEVDAGNPDGDAVDSGIAASCIVASGDEKKGPTPAKKVWWRSGWLWLIGAFLLAFTYILVSWLIWITNHQYWDMIFQYFRGA